MADIRVVYLPPGAHGKKVGLDDFLAAGNRVDELLVLATGTLHQPPKADEPDKPYAATAHGLVQIKRVEGGVVEVPLTNFTAAIVGDISEDDGTAEVRRRFEIEAHLGDRVTRFSIPAAQFSGMGWTTEHLGARAIVYSGFGAKDHARAAIQLLSDDIIERRVYVHTGWRQIDTDWIYLHAGGAIGESGSIGAIEVSLPTALSRYQLPEPPSGREERDAVRASLRLLEIGPRSITVPVLGAVCAPIVGEVDFALHLAGPTGAGKTVLAALAQQHYGAGIDARHLPASWSSTANSLEGLAFFAKDALLVVDDFAPTGSHYDVQRQHREADRLLRAQGNRAGRGRMRSDSTLNTTKYPRGTILSTGEDVPRGQSLRSRMVILEIAPSSLDWTLVTQAQKDAEQGLYAQALAGFIRWVAERYDDLDGRRKQDLADLRAQAQQDRQHRRTPEIVATIDRALRLFGDYAKEVDALDG